MRMFDRRACKPTKIFFSYAKSEIIRISSEIQICLRKRKPGINAGKIRDKSYIDQLSLHDEGYRILKCERNSPSFWEEKKKELFAMVKQLGCPTIFLTLSAAETHWFPLIKHLEKTINKRDISEEDFQIMSFPQKCELLRSDPVSCCRYFDFRTRKLFKFIKAKHSIFKKHPIIDYYFRVEFQQRGSPHIHSMLWLKG